MVQKTKDQLTIAGNPIHHSKFIICHSLGSLLISITETTLAHVFGVGFLVVEAVASDFDH